MKKFWLLIVMLFISINIFGYETKSDKDVYIFIDISGSVDPYFYEMQNYTINEIILKVNIGKKLSIYKFYGKCVNIYDQKVRNNFDLNFAKERILKLLPNGPWTNLDLVKSIIKEKNIDLMTSDVYILTDGHQELEDGNNEYFLSNENVEEFLENCELIKKNNWFLLTYRYKEKSPVAVINSQTSVELKNIVVEKTPKNSLNINLKFLKLIILILLILATLIFIAEIITYIIWKKQTRKSVYLTQYKNHTLNNFKNIFISFFCIGLSSLTLFIVLHYDLNLLLLIFILVSVLIFVIAVIFPTKNIIKNIKYAMQIKYMYRHLIKYNYIELVKEFEIEASICNQVLYLKRKKIEEIEFEEGIKEKQIVLGLALKKIDDVKAIGIQKFSKFYFINLEEIFKQLDLRFTEKERKEIANAISKSYGNDKLDKFDWAMGASLGLITGLMDAFLVGKPGDSKLQKFVDNITEKSVMLAGKLLGYNGKDVSKVIEKLEKKYWVPYDKTSIKEIGMTTNNHHLQSLAHANDIVGLLFAITDTKLSIEKSIENDGTLYTVVTCNYSKDSETIEKIKMNPNLEFILGGAFVRLVEPLTYQSGNNKGEEKNIETLGKKVLYRVLYENCKDADETKRTVMCIISGFVLWLGHLYSDKVGASATAKKGNRGSGISAPFHELFIGASGNINETLKKLGTDKLERMSKDIAKNMFEKGFDNRYYNVQRIPVIINEYLTKIVFIIKETGIYKKNFEISDIIKIMLPEGFIKDGARFCTNDSNFELQKTLLISYSAFSLVDVGDALTSSGALTPAGIVPNIDIFLSINYPGLIKFGHESLSIFLSYLHRWTNSPDRIIAKIEYIAENTAESDNEVESHLAS